LVANQGLEPRTQGL